MTYGYPPAISHRLIQGLQSGSIMVQGQVKNNPVSAPGTIQHLDESLGCPFLFFLSFIVLVNVSKVFRVCYI